MTDACPKCGSQTPIGHRCIVDDLAAIRDADLSDHPLMHAIKGAVAMTDQTAPVLSEEDRLLGVRHADWGWNKVYSQGDVERIVARHRQQAVREALAEVEALADEAKQIASRCAERNGDGIACSTCVTRGIVADAYRAAIARVKGAGA